MQNYPWVGLGAIIVNAQNQILIGKRIGSHAPYYSIPGGHLEVGETFEEGIIREVKEETHLSLIKPQVIAVTNNLETFKESNKHYISIILLATKYTGKLQLLEPEKCEQWIWCDPQKLPTPHADFSHLGVQCYLENKFHCK